MKRELPPGLLEEFPEFARAIERRGLDWVFPEHVLPPAGAEVIDALESNLGLPLPDSYKAMLRHTRGFWLLGGIIQMERPHPFYHRFPRLRDLPAEEQEILAETGQPWPPPSDGMLCFAEFYWQGDGDQLLWDVTTGLIGGEYPIFYYAQDAAPPAVSLLAASFAEWLSTCLDYFEVDEED